MLRNIKGPGPGNRQLVSRVRLKTRTESLQVSQGRLET